MECGGLARVTEASPDTRSGTFRSSWKAAGRKARRGVLVQRWMPAPGKEHPETQAPIVTRTARPRAQTLQNNTETLTLEMSSWFCYSSHVTEAEPCISGFLLFILWLPLTSYFLSPLFYPSLLSIMSDSTAKIHLNQPYDLPQLRWIPWDSMSVHIQKTL